MPRKKKQDKEWPVIRYNKFRNNWIVDAGTRVSEVDPKTGTKKRDRQYCKTREEGFGDEVKRRIMIGTYVLSAGYYDAYYLKAQKIRRLISEDFGKAFKKCDVILGPSAPSVAFPIGDKKEDPLKMYMQDVYTISTNLAGLPGLSMPAGLINNLPVGMQLIGNYFSEAKLLNIANVFQMNTDWHRLSPKGFE